MTAFAAVQTRLNPIKSMNSNLPVWNPRARSAPDRSASTDSTRRALPRNRLRACGAALPVLVLVVGLSAVPSGLIFLACRSVRSVTDDSRVVRQALLKAGDAEWTPTIELGVGGGVLGLARRGLGFADLPPEARAVVNAVRGADVGIYRLTKGGRNRVALLEATDRGMSDRGWERVVGVISGSELVAAYLPRDLKSGRDLRLCVMVLDGEEMVVVGARGNLEPLLKLAETELARVSAESRHHRF